MFSIFRVLVVYLALLVVFRISGKRTLAETTPFDLLMLLILSETTQQAMVGQDHSMTNALLMICTFVGADIFLSVMKQRFETAERVLEDVPLVIVENGVPLTERMHKSRVDEEDVLEAARQLRGLESLEQIKYAVLERNGNISIIPIDYAVMK